MRVARTRIMNIFRTYSAKYARLKTAAGLPVAGLLLYYIMLRLVGLRWLKAAKLVGEFLQHFFGTNYAINNCLANVYRQLHDPGRESKALMRIAMVTKKQPT